LPLCYWGVLYLCLFKDWQVILDLWFLSNVYYFKQGWKSYLTLP
jgi:hypothetical protein